MEISGMGRNGLVRTQKTVFAARLRTNQVRKGGASDTSRKKSQDGANRRRRLRNDGDARNRMYFYPFGVKRVLHQTTNNANMRADSGKIDLVRETLTRGLGVGLSYRELADNFEHQITTFITYVSCVQ